MVQDWQKKRFDKKKQNKSYSVGDLVLVYRPIRKKGRSEKLLHWYYGPYRIVEKINNVNYHVELVIGRKKRRDCVHVNKLKPFHGRPSYFKSKRRTAAPVNKQIAQKGSRPEKETSGGRNRVQT